MKLTMDVLKPRVEALCEAMQAGDMERFEEHLDWLTVLREVQVAEQLRSLQEMLSVNIETLEKDNGVLSATSELSDASERLRYVLESTEQAASKTLDLAESIGEGLSALRDRVAEEDREQVDHLLGEVQALIMTQEYQDLTGQVLKKLIPALEALQQLLEKMVAAAGHNLEELRSRQGDLHKGVGPNVTQASKADSVSNQDEVDDLLDSLGI